MNEFTLEACQQPNRQEQIYLPHPHRGDHQSRLMSRLLLLLFLLLSGSRLPAQSTDELKAQLKNTKDSVEVGKILSRLGNTAFGEGDFVAATSYFFASLRIAERYGDRPTIATNFNNISACYVETENYPEAEAYAKKAVSLYQQLTDHRGLANAYNSLANVYYMQERDSLSLHYFEQSLAERKIINDSVGLSKGYKNLGSLHFEMGDTAAGIGYLKESIRYISSPNDTARWFGSYLNLAQVFVRTGELAMAKFYFDQAQPYAAGSREYNKLEDYYYSLADYYRQKGDYRAALESHERYAAYRDSVVNKEKNGQLAELNIQYETDKQQQLIREQQFQITRRNYWIAGVALFLLLGGLAAYLFYRNVQYRRVRKLREEVYRQKELAASALFEGEQQERIRIARDLHDSIGQQLAAVRMKLDMLPEHPQAADAGRFLDDTIREVRTISHNLLPEALQFGWAAALEELCEKMTVPGGPSISLEIEEKARHQPFSRQQELSLYRIVQEIISNAVRHAAASKLQIAIGRNEHTFFIHTSDDGKGMDTAQLTQAPGIGWKNIIARVHLLHGNINISSQPMSGTQIHTTIPLL